ncbi:MAG: EAL domain-containing protein [Pseudomonadota bacterium]
MPKPNKQILPPPLESVEGWRARAFSKLNVVQADDLQAECFRAIADKSPLGIIVHHFHQPLYANKAWAGLFGFTTEEIMNQDTFIRLTHEADRQRLVRYRDDRLQGLKAPDHYRFRAVHKDGRTLWMEHFVRIIDWQDQQAIMAITVDVDEQERQAVALRRQQELMEHQVLERSRALTESNRELHIHQSILDQLSERISVVDKDYRFRMSNQANLDFRRMSRQQMIGLHVSKTLGQHHFQSSAKSLLDQAFNGQSARSERSEISDDGRRKHVQVITEPFRSPDGQINGAIVSVRDITLAKETEEKLRLFASVFEQISDRVALIDLTYRFRMANKADLDFHQLSLDQVLGRHLADIVGSNHFETYSKPILDRCFRGEKLKVLRTQRAGNGERREVEVFLEPYREVSSQIAGAVVIARDVTEAKEMSDRLAFQARFDQLTGLLNRQTFEEILDESINNTAPGRRPDALCFIDLDQFKIVNDTVGHLAGDRLLQQAAEFLSRRLRDDDVLARFGGDEFVLLLRRCSLGRAKRMTERLIAALSEDQFFHDGLMFRVGASAGITSINQYVSNVNEAMTQADLACYTAKDNGRNQVQIYKKGDSDIRRRQDDMYRAGGIRKALDDDRFILFSQPIMPVVDDASEPAHLEVLLRMASERQRIIKPDAFIPAAERYGLMPEIDRWVIGQTINVMAQQPFLGDETRININVSGVTLSDETSLDAIRQSITTSSVGPERITFEITETAAIRDFSKTQQFMQELQEWGCRFALDDFGSGLSSLNYLRRLPVDYLKIDGSFIRDLISDQGCRVMVMSIQQMAHGLGIQTVAEGVEDGRTLQILKELGIDYAQGFAIATPAPLLSHASAYRQ